MMMFATSSLIGVPRKTMRSISRREKMSYDALAAAGPLNDVRGVNAGHDSGFLLR